MSVYQQSGYVPKSVQFDNNDNHKSNIMKQSVQLKQSVLNYPNNDSVFNSKIQQSQNIVNENPIKIDSSRAEIHKSVVKGNNHQVKIQSNGIKCIYHPDQNITNFCHSYKLPLCPQCVKSHGQKIQQQGKPLQFDTISNVYKDTKTILERNKIQHNNLQLCVKNTELSNQSIEGQLDEIHEMLQRDLTKMMQQIKTKMIKDHEQQNQHYRATFMGLDRELSSQIRKNHKQLQNLDDENHTLKSIIKTNQSKSNATTQLIQRCQHELKQIYQHHYNLEINKPLLDVKMTEIYNNLLMKKYVPFKSVEDLVKTNHQNNQITQNLINNKFQYVPSQESYIKHKYDYQDYLTQHN